MAAYSGGRFVVIMLHYTQNEKRWEHSNRSFCHGVNEHNVSLPLARMTRHFSKARPFEQMHHNKLQKDVKLASVSSQESTFLPRVIQASQCNKVIACLHMHLMHAREAFYYISVHDSPVPYWPAPGGSLWQGGSCKCCLSATRNSYQCANGKKGKRDVTGRSSLNGSPTPCLLGGAKQMRH